MLKKWKLIVALLAIFGMFAAGCGGDDDDTSTSGSTSSDVTAGLVYDIGGRGDQSFNDSAAAGIEKAKTELGIEFTEASPNDDGSNRAELLQLQADNNPIVIAVGFLFATDAATVAANNPDTNFAVIDDAMMDWETMSPLSENAAGLTFAEHEGSFLVGAAAALKSETGTIGFIGGVCCFGLIEKFEAGYIAGAKAVNPNINIISQYITEFPDFDGFNAPDRAKEIGLAMYNDGADIVYHAAGGSGAGLFEAAKEISESSGSKVWGIGVDSDQYNTVDASVQEYVLTSMLKRVDTAVFLAIKSQVDGTFTAGQTAYGLSDDGVGYSTSGGYVDDIVTELDAFKADIIAGNIVVPSSMEAPSSDVKAAFLYVGPPGDAGWTWAHDQGRTCAEEATGATTAFVESVPEGTVDFANFAKDFIAQGYNAIIGTSFGYMDSMEALATEYPDVVFDHISGYKANGSNFGNTFGRMYEPRYLSGIVAGSATTSGQLGYVAAFPIPEVIRGINAFTLGVRSVNPTATVEVNWTSTWFDPVVEGDAAQALIDAGADVIAMHQDSAAAGEKAEAAGVRWVSYNSDMSAFAPNAFLTAPVWDWCERYIELIGQISAGTYAGGYWWGSMADGVVDLAPIAGDVSSDIKDLVAEKKAAIIDGSFHPFAGPINAQDGSVLVADGDTMDDGTMLGLMTFVEGVIGSTG
jgi:basic membrane protein A